MTQNDVIDVLNRLFQVHYRALAVYVQQTRPWTPPGGEKAVEVLAAVAAEQQRSARRIAEAIQEERGRLDPGQFPVAFTSIHDVSVEFLLQRAAELQGHDVRTIEGCAAELDGVPRLRPLAQETLRQARRHLEMLTGRMKDEG